MRITLLLALVSTALLQLSHRHPSTNPPAEKPDAPHRPIVMRFGGDLLLGGRYEESVRDSINTAFEGFDLFRTADVSMVNLENAVTRRGTRIDKQYNFRMNPRLLAVIKEAGISVVSIANNHIYDYGREGFFDTIASLDSAGIPFVGAGRDIREAQRPFLLKTAGRKVGILAYYSGGEAPAATEFSDGVAARELDRIRSDVFALKTKDSADFVIVSLHWGNENETAPDEGQILFAHGLIDAGADAVIGHHPHVLQGIERYKEGVIAYSLGNLVFGGNRRSNYDTGIFEITLDAKGRSYSFIPVRVRHWRASPLRGAAGDSVIRHLTELSRIFPHSIFTNQEKQ